MSLGISLFMSFQFKVHMPLAMQSVMLPITAFESIVVKKYLLGSNKHKDGSDRIYGELLAAPTEAILAKLNAERAAAASTPVAEAIEATASEKEAKDAADTDSKGSKKSTPASDLD